MRPKWSLVDDVQQPADRLGGDDELFTPGAHSEPEDARRARTRERADAAEDDVERGRVETAERRRRGIEVDAIAEEHERHVPLPSGGRARTIEAKARLCELDLVEDRAGRDDRNEASAHIPLCQARPMPLALFDLDNTLVDRASCFRRSIEGLARDHGLDPEVAVPFVIEADADGMRGWDEWMADTRERFGLTHTIEQLKAAHRVRYIAAFAPDVRVSDGLARLRTAGWRIAIVTNGPPSQTEKLRAAELTHLIDACVISDVAGVRKPDPEIFRLAAATAGGSLEGAWMVGDSVEADIAGAAACGIASIWIDRGRRWTADGFAPSCVVPHVVDAIQVLLAAELPTGS